jgi:peptidyl-tRNA hydrolase
MRKDDTGCVSQLIAPLENKLMGSGRTQVAPGSKTILGIGP